MFNKLSLIYSSDFCFPPWWICMFPTVPLCPISGLWGLSLRKKKESYYWGVRESHKCFSAHFTQFLNTCIITEPSTCWMFYEDKTQILTGSQVRHPKAEFHPKMSFVSFSQLCLSSHSFFCGTHSTFQRMSTLHSIDVLKVHVKLLKMKSTIIVHTTSSPSGLKLFVKTRLKSGFKEKLDSFYFYWMEEAEDF